MKKLIQYLAIFALAFSFTGCETIKKISAVSNYTVSEQTNDTLIVSAEKATFIAKDTMDTFLRLEYTNRDAYSAISPQIHTFAETLRRDKNGNGYPDGVDVLKTARVATKSYKANRTPEGELNLRSAYKALQDIISDCKKYSALVTKGP